MGDLGVYIVTEPVIKTGKLVPVSGGGSTLVGVHWWEYIGGSTWVGVHWWERASVGPGRCVLAVGSPAHVALLAGRSRLIAHVGLLSGLLSGLFRYSRAHACVSTQNSGSCTWIYEPDRELAQAPRLMHHC